MDGSGWVAVRCLFRLVGDDVSHYEERVTLWRALDLNEGIARAEVEAREYAASLDTPPDGIFEFVNFAQAYLLDDEPSDGAEVFSLIRTSALAPIEYLNRFFDTGDEHQQLS